MGVPGATGGGELAGALIPVPAPTNPVKTRGALISVWNLNLKCDVLNGIVVVIHLDGVKDVVIEGKVIRDHCQVRGTDRR